MKKTISLISFLCVLGLVIFSLVGYENEAKAETEGNIGTLRSVVTPGFSFRKDLLLGDTDPDVVQLQKVLNADIDTRIATEGPGSRGLESSYFGALTKAAVIKFQNKYKNVVLTLNSITTADGAVNRATRTRLNLLIGVINTYDSVGLPQSRPATITTAPKPQMTTCQFVELLINIGAVTPDKANRARLALGCNTGNFVDLKVNGQDGPVLVAKNSAITLSWITGGMASCLAGTVNKPLTGSESFTVGTAAQTFTLNCKTATGVAYTDNVLVTVGGVPLVNATGTPPKLLDSSGAYFGYSIGLFKINTDVPTRAYVTYRTNSSNARTVSYTEIKASRIETITGLTPNTTYYITIKIVAADGGEYTTPEFTKTTSNNPSDNINPNDILSDATSTKSINIYVNNSVSYAQTIDPMSFANVPAVVTWNSTGFTSCKITSTPTVYSFYESPAEAAGTTTVSLSPIMNEGATTFTLACATGTAVATLEEKTMSEIISIVGKAKVLAGSEATSSNLQIANAVFNLNLAASGEAATEVVEAAAPENLFAGVVVSVANCTEDEDLVEVVIDPCPKGGTTASLFEDGPTPESPDVQTGTLSGQIKVTVRKSMHTVPKVGDLTGPGRAVHDEAGLCKKIYTPSGEAARTGDDYTSIKSGLTGPSSAAEFVGVITATFSPIPDTNKTCPISTGRGGCSRTWSHLFTDCWW